MAYVADSPQTQHLWLGICTGHRHVGGGLWPLHGLPGMASEGLFLQWAFNPSFSPTYLQI